MIPPDLKDEHIRQAIEEVEHSRIPSRRESRVYDLLYNGKAYPPKYVLSRAAFFAWGKEHSSEEFNAVEARDYFRRRNYEVIVRRGAARVTIVEEDDESAFPEGRELFQLHRRLERDGTIPRRAKAKRLRETGALACEVCGLDFIEMYGVLGEGFIEAHHNKRVSQLRGTEKTKISDISLVCSNCHRMLHRSEELLLILELKRIVDDVRKSKA